MIRFKTFFEEFDKLDSNIKKIFSDFFYNENPYLMIAETHWRPNVDVYITPTSIIIKLELAGIRQEDISISYVQDQLHIKGHRSDHSVPEKIGCQQVEINYGDFERTVTLENYQHLIDADNIKATYKDGMLYILLPLLERQEENKKINIKITEG